MKRSCVTIGLVLVYIANVVSCGPKYTACGPKGCKSVGDNGQGVACGPDGCGPIGQPGYQAANAPIIPISPTGGQCGPQGCFVGDTGCGPNGCQTVNSNGQSVGCGPNGCGIYGTGPQVPGLHGPGPQGPGTFIGSASVVAPSSEGRCGPHGCVTGTAKCDHHGCTS